MDTGICLPHTDQLVDIYIGRSIAVTIAVITIAYQALKAAIVNPVKSLRSE